MIYTAQRGVRGFRTPHRYRLEKGSTPVYSPQNLVSNLPLDQIDWQAYGRYMAIPAVSVILLAAFLHGLRVPVQTTHAPAHSSTKPTSSPVLHVTNASSLRAGPSQSTAAVQSASDTVITQPSSPASSRGDNNVTSQIPSAASAGDSLLPVTVPVTIPVSSDPSTPVDNLPIPTDPTTPGTPVSSPTDPSSMTDISGLTVMTPVAQAGVDVFPPSVNLNL